MELENQKGNRVMFGKYTFEMCQVNTLKKKKIHFGLVLGKLQADYQLVETLAYFNKNYLKEYLILAGRKFILDKRFFPKFYE